MISNYSRTGLGAALLVLAASGPAASQDATAILSKLQASMATAKTYQAQWVMNMDMGQMGSMGMSIDLKMEPKTGKVAMKMSPAGTPTGQMAMAAGMLNIQMVDDGKNAYMYMPMMNGYMVGPHRKQNEMSPAGMAQQFARNATAKYLRTEKVSGKPAHVIQVIPKNATPQLGKQTILLYVDKATNRMIQLTMTGNAPAAGPQGKPQKMNMKMVVKKEIVNAALPAGTFKFVPPPGVKKLQGQLGAGMGPMFPGLGGGAPAKTPPAGNP